MKEDNAMLVLTEVHKKLSLDIPADLLKKCYEIEKQHLFEKDRQKTMDILKKLIEDYVEHEG